MRLRATLESPAAAVGDVAASHPAARAHSPIPYLFGGLAAMLALIAIALLLLACSYWKLSGRFDSGAGEDGEKREVEAADGSAAGWEGKVLVIMAGQVAPTFLATPSTSRTSSFGDTSMATVGGGVDGESGDVGKS